MAMKLYLDFEPCDECKSIMKDLSSPDIVFGDENIRKDESAKFLRQLTYNHSEVVQAVMKDLPKQKRSQEYDWFR